MEYETLVKYGKGYALSCAFPTLPQNGKARSQAKISVNATELKTALAIVNTLEKGAISLT